MTADPTRTVPPKITHLSEADGVVLDAMLTARAHGADSGPRPAGSSERAEKMQALFGLLDRDAAEEPSRDLVQRTLARVEGAQQRQRFAEQVQMLASPRRTVGVGWRQIAAAACIFLIGLSVLMPVLDRQRAQAKRFHCASNLQLAGQAFRSYADANGQALPRGRVKPGAVWWNVGQPPDQDGTVNSNSAHLYILVRRGHLDADTLACPANLNAPLGQLTAEHHDWPSRRTVSYSYQTSNPLIQLRIDHNPHLALLADKNPLFIVKDGRVRFDSSASQTASSKMHGKPGQNILTADGAVIWRIRPMVPRPNAEPDNVWVPTGVKPSTGTETPVSEYDSFLTP